MAFLPIYISDIVTPYNIGVNEAADLVIAANNKSSIVRRAGYYYSAVIGIKDRNMRANADSFWRIVSFMAANPKFSVPLHNMQASNVRPEQVVNVTVLAPVNAKSLTISSISERFNPGQYIKFANKPKLYQVLSHVGNILSLMQPLSAAVPASTRIIFKETGYDGEVFNGIMGEFLNEDFGIPNYKIEDGLIGSIGPLTLREVL